MRATGFTRRGELLGIRSSIAILRERLADDEPEGKIPGRIVLEALEADVERIIAERDRYREALEKLVAVCPFTPNTQPGSVTDIIHQALTPEKEEA